MNRCYGLMGRVSISITLSRLTHQGCESGSHRHESTRRRTSKWAFVVTRFASLGREVVSFLANAGCEFYSFSKLLVQHFWIDVRSNTDARLTFSLHYHFVKLSGTSQRSLKKDTLMCLEKHQQMQTHNLQSVSFNCRSTVAALEKGRYFTVWVIG